MGVGRQPLMKQMVNIYQCLSYKKYFFFSLSTIKIICKSYAFHVEPKCMIVYLFSNVHIIYISTSDTVSVMWSLQLRIQLFYCMNTILWESEGRMTFSLRQSYLVMSLIELDLMSQKKFAYSVSAWLTT